LQPKSADLSGGTGNKWLMQSATGCIYMLSTSC